MGHPKPLCPGYPAAFLLAFCQDIEEPYAIAELVVAKSRGQAKWLAWKTERGNTDDVRDMPRFRTAIKAKGVEGPPRIASEEAWADTNNMWCWPEELEEVASEPANT